ncbi:phosphatidylinositol 4,5-bisphosphate 3-kinase catalytic subunit gamma isoform-like isoform X2 [Corticium candelabrum]|uniref:phosphatidylinositol 4,5-bisphosphate 3-kinase catalytic subunit gamma isoform-like isoform X2 n=1 Tax=Corticium candelabrum TaxID=121492 RepID=UPI002E25DF17|nr:phosphatidylinositol 4,5-bisphosphate 3-kinase catalytic subunit gamma isoform-like isoform X2 [Corticium candelabrum]
MNSALDMSFSSPLRQEPNVKRTDSKLQLHKRASGLFSFRRKNKPLEFVLPNGNTIILESCPGNWSVREVKDAVWKELQKSKKLDEPDMADFNSQDDFTLKYHMDGNVYELFDELQLLQTLKIYRSWFLGDVITTSGAVGQVFVSRKHKPGDREKHFDLRIGYIMGRDLRELSFADDSELDWTRRVLTSVCQEALKQRDPKLYAMEPDILSIAPPSHVLKKCTDGTLEIEFFVGVGTETGIVMEFDVGTKASNIVGEAFQYFSKTGQASGSIHEYTLKVCGYEEYVWGDHSILKFRHIQKCLINESPIQLTLVKTVDPSSDRLPDILQMDLVDDNSYLGGTHEQLTAENKKKEDVFLMSMWDIEKEFRLKLEWVDHLEVPTVKKKSGELLEVGNVFIEATITNGGAFLTPILSCSEYKFASVVRFTQWLKTQLKVKNIPKAARLCIVVKAHVRNRNYPLPIYWVNLQLLDHRGVLKTGRIKLFLWPTSDLKSLLKDDVGFPGFGLQLSGSVAQNPNAHAPSLYMELDKYCHHVACPHSATSESLEGQSPSIPSHHYKGPPAGSPMEEMLLKIIRSDALIKLDDTERDLVEAYRHYLSKNYPEALPKYLLSVKWWDVHCVLEARHLVGNWVGPMSLEVALQLLDYQIADEDVRQLGVKRLEVLQNDELELYLLQLVQVLKFEPYYDNSLTRFLLKRALLSKRLGFRFFWYLAAELEAPEYRHRFAALLEAYLRYCGSNVLDELYKQRHAVNTLRSITKSLKEFLNMKGTQREQGVDFLHEKLSAAIANRDFPPTFLLPYNSSLRVGYPIATSCKFMTSNKKPLWLEFKNVDSFGKSDEPVRIIFKVGDDLHQDMLSLQMLNVMERLWHEKGFNFHLLPYACLATGMKEGLIEVVPKAETIARIQMKADEVKSALERNLKLSTLKTDTISEWLKGSPGWRSMLTEDMIVDKFVLSCAGYCIATYVLGIADRHSDNIMLTTDGNLFHIDFGHFLGNVKYFRWLKHIEIKRERLPFVLTPDFVHVMGGQNGEAFLRFRKKCGEAYAVLRERLNLFINLFHMMIPSGMKELSGAKDITYLQKALCSDCNEQKAEEHIQAQINCCLQDGWTTMIDWWFHRARQPKSSS